MKRDWKINEKDQCNLELFYPNEAFIYQFASLRVENVFVTENTDIILIKETIEFLGNE